MNVVIIGGGIGGLTLALYLHQAGISCTVFETASVVKPLGVGLNLLPHATAALAEVNVVDRLLTKGVETKEVQFYTRHGQLVDREDRGRFAGYASPQISIHRADFHDILLQAVRERLGPDRLHLGMTCMKAEQDEGGVSVVFMTTDGELRSISGDIAVACDGIHSSIRRQFFPQDSAPIDHGTTCFRGVTRWKPFLSGASMAYVGTYDTGKLVTYPIRENIDSEGRQLINWVIEIKKQSDSLRDWNRRVGVEEFFETFKDWRFDWLDIPAMLRSADEVLQYPNVDQNPLPFWTKGRITLLGDAAHPMLPRGSNGSAQAILDAKLLTKLLADRAEPSSALQEYERQRLPVTADIVLNNRTRSPDEILRVVDERCGGKPFDKITDVIGLDELKEWQASYKRVAGFEISSTVEP